MLDTVTFFAEYWRSSPDVCRHGQNEVYVKPTFEGSCRRTSPLLLVGHLISIFIFILTLIRSFYTIEWPCYNVNDCAVWLLSWNHITVAILIQISSISCRRRRLLGCLHEARTLARRCVRPQQRRSRICLFRYHLCLTTLFLIKACIPLCTGQTNELLAFVFHNISYLIPLSMECLLLLLCSVIKDVCSEINVTVAELAVDNRNVIMLAGSLKSLIDRHQEVANLLNKVSTCFSRDLLVDLAFNMIWFIIYIYVTTVALCTPGSSIGRNACLILEIIFLATRVCFLSYSVNRIECESLLTPSSVVIPRTSSLQARSTSIQLRNLHCRKLNSTCSQLVNQFLQQVAANGMKMNVCGLFYVDSSFMRGVISLATTYLIVFIQYGLGETSSGPSTTMFLPNSSTPSSLQ